MERKKDRQLTASKQHTDENGNSVYEIFKVFIALFLFQLNFFNCAPEMAKTALIKTNFCSVNENKKIYL